MKKFDPTMIDEMFQNISDQHLAHLGTLGLLKHVIANKRKQIGISIFAYLTKLNISFFKTKPKFSFECNSRIIWCNSFPYYKNMYMRVACKITIMCLTRKCCLFTIICLVGPEGILILEHLTTLVTNAGGIPFTRMAFLHVFSEFVKILVGSRTKGTLLVLLPATSGLVPLV